LSGCGCVTRVGVYAVTVHHPCLLLCSAAPHKYQNTMAAEAQKRCVGPETEMLVWQKHGHEGDICTAGATFCCLPGLGSWCTPPPPPPSPASKREWGCHRGWQAKEACFKADNGCDGQGHKTPSSFHWVTSSDQVLTVARKHKTFFLPTTNYMLEFPSPSASTEPCFSDRQ
jgi:hypothetical protein